MPFINLNVEEFKTKPYDYTIIGAGAVGILLAIKLNNLGKKVCLIESGHFKEDSVKQDLNEVSQSGKFLNTAVWGRKRAIGGTTIAWGGQSLPFTKFDFKQKDWHLNSGWDIPFEEVNKFYHEANKFMGVDNWGYGNEILEKIDLSPILDPDFQYHVSKWANTPNFAELYQKELKENIDLYYNAHLIGIKQIDNAVSSIQLSNFKKEEKEIKIKNLILATGGIETIRILLLNKLSKSSNLGQGFMEHPCIDFGELTNYHAYSLQKRFNTHFYKKRKYSLRLSLTDEFQERHQSLNASVSVLFEYGSSDFDPYAEIKNIRSWKLNSIPNILKSVTYMTPTLYSYLRHNFYYKPKATPKLNMMLEQTATPTSSISLSQELDAFNQPKAHINWEIDPLSWHTFKETANSTVDFFNRHGFGKAKIREELINYTGNDWQAFFSGVNHHMGGAKLGKDPNNSIVDTNLKLWGFENIFICSSATFPTGSHSNPTLTLLALGCRLVQHLNTIHVS